MTTLATTNIGIEYYDDSSISSNQRLGRILSSAHRKLSKMLMFPCGVIYDKPEHHYSTVLEQSMHLLNEDARI